MSPDEEKFLRKELVAYKNLISVLRERLAHYELIVKEYEEKLGEKKNG